MWIKAKITYQVSPTSEIGGGSFVLAKKILSLSIIF